jgi:hypothetical protein
MQLPEPWATYYQDAVELAIEESIREYFHWWEGDIRDDAYGAKDAEFSKNCAALILVGLYAERGCNMGDLALELLMHDTRNRDVGAYPITHCATIEVLFNRYRELAASDSIEGKALRSACKGVLKIVEKKLGELERVY